MSLYTKYNSGDIKYGENAEKLNHSYMADEIITWYNHSGSNKNVINFLICYSLEESGFNYAVWKKNMI